MNHCRLQHYVNRTVSCQERANLRKTRSSCRFRPVKGSRRCIPCPTVGITDIPIWG